MLQQSAQGQLQEWAAAGTQRCFSRWTKNAWLREELALLALSRVLHRRLRPGSGGKRSSKPFGVCFAQDEKALAFTSKCSLVIIQSVNQKAVNVRVLLKISVVTALKLSFVFSLLWPQIHCIVRHQRWRLDYGRLARRKVLKIDWDFGCSRYECRWKD